MIAKGELDDFRVPACLPDEGQAAPPAAHMGKRGLSARTFPVKAMKNRPAVRLRSGFFTMKGCRVMRNIICTSCPRQCKAARSAREGRGYCRMPYGPVVARAALHKGEEPCISGDPDGPGGSGTVFFSGCSLSCVFCQNAPISHDRFGKSITPARLAEIFRELVEQGAYNINLVNPTHFVPAILDALALYRPPVPIVYNTSGYERVEILRQLEGAVDIYLPDLKYADAGLSEALSGAADYPAIATDAILEMARQTGPMRLGRTGFAVRGTMVRHLVLPGHTRDSMRVLDWMSENLPAGVFVSLMFQYTPIAAVPGHPELSRRLTPRECRKVWNYLLEKGLTDGYVQQRESAGGAFIPAFDLTGV